MGITKKDWIRQLLNGSLALVLVLVPFHAFLSVLAGHLSGHYEVWRVWKDLLLLLLVPLAGIQLWRHRAYWRELDTRWIFWASVCYVVLTLALGGLAYQRGQVNSYALVYALVINLRFVLMFWLCLVAASQSAWLRRHWRQMVLWPGAAVIVFGLLQYFVLPAGFLGHFGYGPGTIMPYDTVDQKLDYIRVQSFLRGANPLGAYLVLVLSAAAGGLIIKGRPWTTRRSLRAGLIALGLITLMVTYSRSAYIGTAIALATLAAYAFRRHITRGRVLGLTAGLILICGVALMTLRHNDSFQNVFFHTDEHSHSGRSSNAGRRGALSGGLHDVITEPFGRGPGTAGPASLHNDAPGRLAENYFLQIGQETGLLGLALFIALNIFVGIKLWRQRSDVLSRVLLASLLGLTVINMLSHAWADDTISLLWWGLAGVALANTVLPKPSGLRKVTHGKIQ